MSGFVRGDPSEKVGVWAQLEQVGIGTFDWPPWVLMQWQTLEERPVALLERVQ